MAMAGVVLALKGRIATSEGVIRGGVLIEGGRIKSLFPSERMPRHCRDYGDALIVPGFIDVHLHGVGQFGVSTTEDIIGASALLPAFGTTGFLPTLASQTEEQYLAFGRAVRAAQAEAQGAAILGAHFEGPFINPARKGGMAVETLRPMDVAECRRYLDALGGTLRIMVLSPELPGSEAVIALLRAGGVVASLGHTDLSADALPCAAAAGVTHVCHLYNAFRRPGLSREGAWTTDLIEAVLAEERLTCEVNCDLCHVSVENVRAAARALAPDRFVAITDSVQGAGAPEGEYVMADGRRYITVGGVARTVDGGVLVGSMITMDRAFRNLVERIELDPALAARFTSANPARALGLHADTGRLAPGFRADLAVIDGDHRCIATLIAGRLVHEA